MADLEKLNSLLGNIDDLIGSDSNHTAREFSPTSLADKLSEATGLPSAVVGGNPYDTDLQQALQAARAVVMRSVLPPEIGKVAGEAAQNINIGLAED